MSASTIRAFEAFRTRPTERPGPVTLAAEANQLRAKAERQLQLAHQHIERANEFFRAAEALEPRAVTDWNWEAGQ